MPVMPGKAGSTSRATANFSRVIVIATGGGTVRASRLETSINLLCCRLNSSVLSFRTRESDSASLMLASSCCSSTASNFPARACRLSRFRSFAMFSFKLLAQSRYSDTTAASLLSESCASPSVISSWRIFSRKILAGNESVGTRDRKRHDSNRRVLIDVSAAVKRSIAMSSTRWQIYLSSCLKRLSSSAKLNPPDLLGVGGP